MRRTIAKCLLAASLASTWSGMVLARTTVAGGGAAGQPSVPLCDRVARVLSIEHGAGDYLTSYRRLIRGISGVGMDPGSVRRHLALHKRAVSSLIAAIEQPRRVAALRDALLAGANIEGTGSASTRHWGLGTPVQRMLLAGYLAQRAGELYSAGKRLEAEKFADAAFLLDCQESCIRGWWLILAILWRHFQGLTPTVMSNIAKTPKEYHAMWRSLALAPVALGLGRDGRRAIEHLYLIAVQRKAATGRRLGTFFQACKLAGAKEKSAAGHRLRQRIIQMLPRLLARASGMGERAHILRNVKWEKLLASHRGRRRLVLAINRSLAAALAAIGRDRRLSPLERRALSRWIKEVMGP